jgi:predicted nucleotidyltransferase
VGYDPDRIILFGSRAAGHGAADSDFDLLVIKRTDLGPIDRRIAVERLLVDRGVPLGLLVYTPSELRTLYAAGSPFIEEVFRTGRVVFMRKQTKAWMAQARDEFETADILLSNEKYQAVGFSTASIAGVIPLRRACCHTANRRTPTPSALVRRPEP